MQVLPYTYSIDMKFTFTIVQSIEFISEHFVHSKLVTRIIVSFFGDLVTPEYPMA